MSEPINDGGPAFPTDMELAAEGHWRPIQEGGLTIRDYFAGQALAGVAAQSSASCFGGDPQDANAFEKWRLKLRADDAEYCYQLADAMLAARNQPTKANHL